MGLNFELCLFEKTKIFEYEFINDLDRIAVSSKDNFDIELFLLKKIIIFDGKVTHNLNRMAISSGIYEVLWRPKENGHKYAKDIIVTLKKGFEDLKSNPENYKKLNPENGWGSYEEFVTWIEKLINVCNENPNAEINVSK